MTKLDETLILLKDCSDGLTFKEIGESIDTDTETIRVLLTREASKADAKIIIDGESPKKIKLSELGILEIEKKAKKETLIKHMAEEERERLAREEEQKRLRDLEATRINELIEESLAVCLSQNQEPISETLKSGKKVIELDLEQLKKISKDTFIYAIANPKAFFLTADNFLNQYLKGNGLIEPTENINMRFKPLVLKENTRRMAEVRSVESAKKLLSFEAVIMSASNMQHRITAATFECSACSERIVLLQENDHFETPHICACGNRRSFNIIFKKKVNEQLLTLQESEHSSNPVQLKARLRGSDLCDSFMAENRKFFPGEKLRFIGIADAEQQMTKFGISTIETPYIDIKNYATSQTTSFDLTQTEIQELKDFAKKDGAKKELIGMIAPHLELSDSVREGILCQLFGGVKTEKTRGAIHILLAGDPSTAKTQILRNVSNLATKGLFTSCSAATTVGLTASIRNDKTTGNYVIEAGALVLANGGLCAIDELDKIHKTEEGHLNSAMEDSVFRVDKATVHISLPSDSAVLAASNPRTENESFDDYNASFISQIGLSHTLYTRFDLVFVFRDICDEKLDKAIAEKILSPDKIIYPLNIDFFKKYVFYARQINPIFANGTTEALKVKYLKLRKACKDAPISERSTPRDLAALRRLSEAEARIRLSDVVESCDVETAQKIYGASLKEKKSLQQKEDVEK